MLDWMRCSECRFFDRRADREDGRCRRKAPSGRGSSHWPEVSVDDWCGDFAAGGQTLILTDEGIFAIQELSADDQRDLRAALEQMAGKQKEVKP